MAGLVTFGLSLWLLIEFSWNTDNYAKLDACSHAVVMYTEVITYSVVLIPAAMLCLCLAG